MRKLMSLLLCVVLFLSVCGAASAEENAFTVVAPNGAPGIALATLAVNDPDHFPYVAADTIASVFAANEADFIIAPLNAGAKLYKAGKSTYKLAAVVTWGNLCFASQRPDFTLESMNGAVVTLFGENTINASVALRVLEQNGVTPSEIQYLAGAANTQSLLLTDAEAIVLTAEPAVTAAKIKNPAVTAYPLSTLGAEQYTQAALFVRAETLEAQPEAVAAFLEKAAAACAQCTDDVEAVAEASVTLGILPNAKVAVQAIPDCSIRFVPALEAREAVEATVAIDPAQFGGAVPADDFYYAAK